MKKTTQKSAEGAVRDTSAAQAARDASIRGDDFRDIRAAEFGLLESRTIGHDFRRTGAVEAIAGDATPAALSHAMGNTLSASTTLFATYCPVNQTSLEAVITARKLGRRRLRENRR